MIILNLPRPPSTNNLWRYSRGRVHLSAEYRKWKAEADKMVLASAALRGARCIEGDFGVDILLNKGRGDLDNFVKAAVDLLQRYNLVRNDSGLVDLRVSYGETKHGCWIKLWEVSEMQTNMPSYGDRPFGCPP